MYAERIQWEGNKNPSRKTFHRFRNQLKNGRVFENFEI